MVSVDFGGRNRSEAHQTVFAITPPLVFHHCTMDIGEDGVGIRSIVPKLGNDCVGFCDVVTKIENGPMGVSR